MAVVAVQIISEEITRTGGQRTGTRVYRVDVDSLTDTAETALDADDGTTAVAEPGDAWSGTSGMTCNSQRVTNYDDDQLTYEVTCEFSTRKLSLPTIENPLSRPNSYSYSSSNVTEPYFRDTEDKPIVNSAGEPFADLPQRDVSRGTISITRNVSDYDDEDAQSYLNTINASAVTIRGVTYAARTLRIVGWEASGPHEENGIEFWTETITIAGNPNTWDHVLEDRGLNELVTVDGDTKLVSIKDADGEPVVLPWPLDGSGKAKPNATDAPEVGTAKPYLAGAFPSGL